MARYVPIVGGFWPVGQLLDAYMYKIQLSNMRFGGSEPKFNEEFSYWNYIVKFYTVCGSPDSLGFRTSVFIVCMRAVADWHVRPVRRGTEEVG